MDGKTGDTAIPLTNDQSVNGSLVGTTSGAFMYYSFPYAGDGKDAILTMHYSPSDPTTANAFGVVLWQGNIIIGKINGNGMAGTRGATSLTFFTHKAGTLLAQVYNYHDGVDVNFDITVTGIPANPAAAGAPAPAA